MRFRSSTSTGYLNEKIVTQGNEFYPDKYGVDDRNLVILSKAIADNIIFYRKKGQNIAVGVRYIRDGFSQKAYARKVHPSVIQPTLEGNAGWEGAFRKELLTVT